MVKKIKRYIFLFFGTLLFISHFFYSTFPRGSLKIVNEEIKNLFLSLKIHRENILINKDGREFFILSYGFNFDKRFSKVIFGFDKNYYAFEYKKGIWIFIFEPEKSNVKIFNLKENIKEFNEFISFNSDFIIFVSIAGDASFLWNEEIEEILKRIGLKENFNDKYGVSYIFVAKKEKEKFIPIYEKISKDRAIYLKIKI